MDMIKKFRNALGMGAILVLTSVGLLTGCGQPVGQEESDNPQNVQESEVDQDDNPNVPRQNGDDEQGSGQQGQDDDENNDKDDKAGD